MMVAYLRTYHEARWPEIEDLLLDKVSDALNEKDAISSRICSRRCG